MENCGSNNARRRPGGLRLHREKSDGTRGPHSPGETPLCWAYLLITGPGGQCVFLVEVLLPRSFPNSRKYRVTPGDGHRCKIAGSRPCCGKRSLSMRVAP